MAYVVVAYLRVEPDPDEQEIFDTYEEALAVKEQLEEMQPEDIFEIEEVKE